MGAGDCCLWCAFLLLLWGVWSICRSAYRPRAGARPPPTPRQELPRLVPAPYRPPPGEFPAPVEFGDFEPGSAYRARARAAFQADGVVIRLRNPIRVSSSDPRRNPDHWLFEVPARGRPGRWFFVRGRAINWRGRPNCYEVADVLVPDEVKDRAAAFWLRGRK